jgi:hypothetical protein
VIERRQLAQLGRQPFELIFVDLKHRFESDHDPTNSNFALRAVRDAPAVRFLLGAT